MNETEKLPLSAFMPHHPSSNPHAPFTATAGKKNKDLKKKIELSQVISALETCLLYTSPSPRDGLLSRMPSSA